VSGNEGGAVKLVCQERRVELWSLCVRQGGWSCAAYLSGMLQGVSDDSTSKGPRVEREGWGEDD
jgi:hypothetical protein